MEEKGINELSDEALDAVTGGAHYQYNQETGEWDVFKKNGTLYQSYSRESEAKRVIMKLAVEEAKGAVKNIDEPVRPYTP